MQPGTTAQSELSLIKQKNPDFLLQTLAACSIRALYKTKQIEKALHFMERRQDPSTATGSAAAAAAAEQQQQQQQQHAVQHSAAQCSICSAWLYIMV